MRVPRTGRRYLSAFDGAEEAIALGDFRAMLAMDRAFHRAVAYATHNPTLARYIIALQNIATRFWIYAMERETPAEQLADVAKHRALGEAIAAGRCRGCRGRHAKGGGRSRPAPTRVQDALRLHPADWSPEARNAQRCLRVLTALVKTSQAVKNKPVAGDSATGLKFVFYFIWVGVSSPKRRRSERLAHPFSSQSLGDVKTLASSMEAVTNFDGSITRAAKSGRIFDTPVKLPAISPLILTMESKNAAIFRPGAPASATFRRSRQTVAHVKKAGTSPSRPPCSNGLLDWT